MTRPGETREDELRRELAEVLDGYTVRDADGTERPTFPPEVTEALLTAARTEGPLWPESILAQVLLPCLARKRLSP